VTRALAGLLALAPVAPFGGCEIYDSPPRVFVVDLVDGNLPDASAPIVLEFSEPIVPSSLSLKIALLETDIEGNLFDEDAEDATDEDGNPTELTTFYVHSGGKDQGGGVGVLSEDGRKFTITLDAPLPIGPVLVLQVEPGLDDPDGTSADGTIDATDATKTRQRIPFGYKFSCQAGASSAIFREGAYFFVVDVDVPLPTQLQLWVYFTVDTETGVVTGQFTNADRIPGGQCGCEPSEACRTTPSKGCVVPSEKAGTADEFVDFIPNLEPPEGYTFRANGCVADQPDGSVSFGNAPVDVAIEQPPVTVVGTQLTAQFVLGDDGVLRCSGSFTGDQVLLGTVDSGPASGTFTGRSVTEAETPADIPMP
jgi:hypothetical protein